MQSLPREHAPTEPSQAIPYLKRRSVMVALLSIAAVACFIAVSFLSRAYHAQQQTLGDRWFHRGMTDLQAQRFRNAVVDFRTALRYSRDDYSYQLNLAEALIGQNRSNEAYAYLLTLWERQPENGFVNLELARIAAQRNQTEQALRHYHNAIYATWPGDQESDRQNTRLELIKYLLKIDAKPQAQAELIALAANLGEEPSEQAELGTLFLQALDYDQALAAFRASLKADPHNQTALAGAGRAAFQLANYPLAQQYLQEAVAADPEDTESIERLKTTEEVLLMDPYRQQISVAERARNTAEAFRIAGERLQSCATTTPSGPSANSLAGLADSWAKMKPRVTDSALRRNPDSVNDAMELVFNIERQTNTDCGTPSGLDRALLLIAKLHEGS